EVARVVAEVAVHVHEVVVVVLHRVAHGSKNSGAEAELASAVQDVDARVGGGQLVGQLAGAVGRVVVDDQHLGGRQHLPNLREQRREVVALVVGGERDENARGTRGRHGRSFAD